MNRSLELMTAIMPAAASLGAQPITLQEKERAVQFLKEGNALVAGAVSAHQLTIRW